MAGLIPIAATLFLYKLAVSNRDVKYETAALDGRRYLVLTKPDSKDAANVLASVRRDLESLVDHAAAEFPDDESLARLKAKFDPNAISEGSPGSGYTSYTVDKGARIVLCIRQADHTFVPKNVIMYVAIHELAHIMSTSVGHTEEFWTKFERLLDIARVHGSYKDQDFKKAPQPYCGIHIRG